MKKILIIGGVVLAVIIGGLVLFAVVCREETPSAPAVKGDAPPGWVPTEEEKETPWYKKLSPIYQPSKADEVLKPWPRGSRVVHVETEKGEHVEVGILPDGEVFIPDNQPHKVTVYHKPERDVALEFRPFIGPSLGTNGPGAIGGIDVVKLWRVHVGLGVAVGIKDKKANVAGVGAVGWNVWRNVDVKGYGGATLKGERVFGGAVTIGIE